MTTTTQTIRIYTRPLFTSRYNKQCYQVIVNAEDGNYQEYEIEATSYEEAEAMADRIAQEAMIDVTFVELYLIA